MNVFDWNPRSNETHTVNANGHGTGETRSRVSSRGRRRAQSNVLAIVLLIGITVGGMGVAVSIGTDSLDETRTHAALEQVEQSLLSFDSQSSSVSLGDSRSRVIDLGDSRDGHFSILEDAGSIRVTHENYSEDGDVQVIYQGDMGTLQYQHEGTTMGYQAGGVWRAQGNSSAMVTPPSLIYQDETLVMPIIRLVGEGYVSGPTQSAVRSKATSGSRFPNASLTYDENGLAYQNPVQHGLVTVTVQSAYYRGWAEYFRTRTDGTVAVDPSTESVTMELTASGTSGDFQMPKEGNGVEVRGLAGDHGVENFTIVLAPDDSDAANFDNLQWAMYVDNGPREIELHLRKSGEVPTGRRCNSEAVSMTIYYSESNGDPYHGWKDDSAFQTECTDRDGDGVDDETRLVANLTGSNTLTMQDLSSRELTHFNPSGASLRNPLTIDEHEETVGWEPVTYDVSGDATQSLRNVTRHYLSSLGSNYDLIVDDKNSDTVNEDASRGTLVYEGEGKVTFMHISEHELEVELNG